ncbi:ABC transporter substrate-binding protein [Iodobacter sp. CM08]|uniref:substrate-binding periplasmic protein n=1 Tax=Iodobacter sp. CM08 TaxID=3085902 RepID=UPI002981198F|nr:ABC transporter substrate-binding protein [Iodobacter sp. CM08]MDW5415572.1 ABC transporter substrate-binding protein [Iodobacter sp. CM08]
MLKLKWISLCYLLCAAAFADPPLRIAAQEGVSPKFIFQSNPLTGQCPDILRAIEQLDPSIHFDLDPHPTPMARVEYGLFTGGLDAACALLETTKRSEGALRIATPLYFVQEKLLARSDDKVRVKSFNELAALGGLVATPAGAAYVQLLKARGIAVDDSSGDSLVNLKKVLSKRVRFFYISELSGLYAIRANHLEGQLQLLPDALHQEAMYFWLSKKVPPAMVIKVENALKQLQNNGELQRIFRSYQDEF